MADDDNISIRATIRDELSKPLARMREEVRELRTEVAKANTEQKRHTKTTSSATKEQKAFAAALNKTKRESDRAAKAAEMARMKEGERRVRAFNSALRSTDSTLRSVSRSSMAVAHSAATRTTQAIGAATAAMTGFGVRSVATMEGIQTGLNTLLGPVAGNSLMAQLLEFDKLNPFQLPDIAGVARKLAAFGAPTDQIFGLTKSIADIVAGGGGDIGNLQQASLAIAQIASKGKVMGQEARQLSEQGIDAYSVLGEMYGKTRAQIQELSDAGQDFPAAPFLARIVSLEGPALQRFQGMSATMAQTLTGQWGMFTGNLRNDLVTAFKPLGSELKQFLPAMTPVVGEFVRTVAPSITQLAMKALELIRRLLPFAGPALAGIFQTLLRVTEKLEPYFVRLLDSAPEVGTAFSDFGEALIPLAPVLGDLLVASTPVLIAMATLATILLYKLTPALKWVVDKFGGLIENSDGAAFAVAGVLFVLAGWSTMATVIGGISSVAGAIWGIQAASMGAATALGIAAGAVVALAVTYASIRGDVQNAEAEFKKTVANASTEKLLEMRGQVHSSLGERAGMALTGTDTPESTINAELARRYKGTPAGDPRGHLGRTRAFHAAVDGATPGSRSVTSSTRTWGLASGDSGHHPSRGTALDMTGSWMQTYASNLKKAGGWATIHDAGSGRHLHGEYGDTIAPPRASASSGGGDLPPIIIQATVYGEVDMERAVRRGIEKYNRDRKERR